MNSYLILKWVHILSSVLMVGTGFGTAFYMFFTNRTKNVNAIAEVSKLVVKADTWFTTPAIIVQPVSGVLMALAVGWDLFSGWLLASIVLYVVTGACWLPVVWLQIKMRNMAVTAQAKQQPIPSLYWRYAKYWEYLGYPAFIAMLAVYYLMVNKPF